MHFKTINNRDVYVYSKYVNTTNHKGHCPSPSHIVTKSCLAHNEIALVVLHILIALFSLFA